MTDAFTALMTDAGSKASDLTGRDYLSWSQIDTYRACPLKYRFRYVDRLPEETVSVALVFGSGIHAALEHYFRALLVGESAPDAENLLQVFWDAWDGRRPEGIRFGRGENVDSIVELGRRVLVAFCESPLTDPGGTILGVEEEVRGAVIAGAPELLGRIDLLVESDDELVLVDFKTARSRWSSEQVQQSGEQLLLYADLVRDFAPEKPLRLEYRLLTKAKNPAAETYAIAYDPYRSARTRQVASHVWRAIEAGHFYPAPSPVNCSTCPFREPCAVWKTSSVDGISAEDC